MMCEQNSTEIPTVWGVEGGGGGGGREEGGEKSSNQ